MGIFILVLVAIAAPALASPKIGGIRIGDYPNHTRFVLDISEKVDFSVFTLADPYRVVIDLPEVVWHRAARIAPRGKRITGYRFGLFEAGRSRVVIDLKSAVRIKQSFILPSKGARPYRVVLDIEPVTRTVMLGEIEKARQKIAAPPRTAAATRPPVPVKPKRRKLAKKPLVMIDPGHGGVDPGARSQSGAWEKHIVLNQARVLRRHLLETGRYRVHLTREKDIFLRLRKRIAIAQDMQADLFLSLHADSIKNRNVRGASIYTLSEKASDKEASMLAEKENKADIIAGIDLNDKSKAVARILIDLRQRLTKNESVRFADMLVSELRGKVPLLRKHRRYAGFAVLKAPDVPSVLVEMGYLSNRRDERMLRSRKHQERFAASVVQAVDTFFRRQRALYAP